MHAVPTRRYAAIGQAQGSVQGAAQKHLICRTIDYAIESAHCEVNYAKAPNAPNSACIGSNDESIRSQTH